MGAGSVALTPLEVAVRGRGAALAGGYQHQYAPGYLAWRLPEFRDIFAERYVQLMANLLQVSSAFGRAMETVDRTKTAKAIYPALRARRLAGVDDATLEQALTCAADGYPFPSNLDLDANVGGLTPLAQTDLVRQALAEDWEPEQVDEALDAYATRHRADEI